MSFDHLQSIYRAYDIRGEYPTELNETEAYKIGRAVVVHTNAKNIVVGRDIRSSSPALFEALTKGITEQGANVINLGLASTPMVYFASGHLNADASVAITASHMPCQFNGLKICSKGVVPMGLESGLSEIKALVEEDIFEEPDTKGSITEQDITEEYYKKQFSYLEPLSREFTIVADPANGMGILELPLFAMIKDRVTLHSIYDEYDETCPHHEANPIKLETLADLGVKVVELQADFGIAYDSDADRIGITDENGVPVPADMIGALIIKGLLKDTKEQTVVYDVRSSKIVPEIIETMGSRSVEAPIGHTHAKGVMRKHDAILGVELSSHFFFRDFFTSEAGSLLAIILLNVLEDEKKTLSELVADVQKYFHSGEINSTVSRRPEEIYTELEEKYRDATITKLDGIKIEYENWWCNVRPSQNDPVMRLNLEAHTKELMDEKVAELLTLIRS